VAEQPQFLEIAGPGGEKRRLAYRLGSGAGPGLVWLGGFRSDMTGGKAEAVAAWAAANGRACLRFDYSGHGASSGDPEGGVVGDWLADAEAVFERLAPGPQILVGSSMGAWIALLLARRLIGAGRIAGLVFIAPAWDMTEELMWRRFPDETRARIMAEGSYRLPSAYGAGGYAITRRLIEDGRAHLVAGAPFDPGCPVRILHGMRDADVPWRHSLALVEGVLAGGDVRLTLVKDAEHRLSRPQDLDLLIAAIAGLS
jgi:pimeloyl-ACP methyl ester carboxylesterase